MTQQEGETIKSFAARVKGNCNISETCSKADFTEKVSLMEETVVMYGISDKDIREKGLTQAMITNVKDLPTLLNNVTAEKSTRVTSGVHYHYNIKTRQRRGMRPDKPNLSTEAKHCGHCASCSMDTETRTGLTSVRPITKNV